MKKKKIAILAGLLASFVINVSAMPAPEAEASSEQYGMNIAFDNRILGDEHNFMRIANDMNAGISQYYSVEELVIDKKSKSLSIMNYFHYTDDRPEALARNVTLILSFPETIASGNSGEITAQIVYTDMDESYRIANETKLQTGDLGLFTKALKLTVSDKIVAENTVLLPSCPNDIPETLSGYGNIPAVITTLDGITAISVPIGDMNPGYDAAGYIFTNLEISRVRGVTFWQGIFILAGILVVGTLVVSIFLHIRDQIGSHD